MLKKISLLFIWAAMIPAFQAVAQIRRSDQVLSAELTRFRLMTERDTLHLPEYLSEELVYIHSNALTENAEEHIRAISNGKIIYQRINRKQAKVRLYGRTAIVNGEIQVSGLLNNTPFDVFMLYTAVYRKKRGNWQLINWQSTRRTA